MTAQHGTLDDPADHGAHGSAQVLKWVPRVPTLGRTTVQNWDFNTSSSGWTTNNSPDPTGGWVRAASTPPTRYADAPLAPNVPAGGTGWSWFTGNGNASMAANDCDGRAQLISPVFDGTGGKTIFSFDYWSHTPGWPGSSGLQLQVSNGSTTVTFQDIRALTVQPFDTATDRGWQRAEVDLSTLVTPTAAMRVTFVSIPDNYVNEFGVDNVRVEQATVCGRAGLRVTGVAVDDSPPGWGNGNGWLDPGETARLFVTLTNNGSVSSPDPVGVLIPRTPGLLVHEARDFFPTIGGGGGAGTSLGQGFTITTPGEMDCGGTLVVDLEITDAAGTMTRTSVNLEGGRTETTAVFTDTFETDLGWNAAGASGDGIWQWGDPVGTVDGTQAANPETDSPNDPDANCFVTENGLPGEAAGLADVDSPGGNVPTLESPPFDLTGFKRASFSCDVWYYDNSSSRSFWEDFSQVQVYIADGLLNWYNYTYFGDKTGGWKPLAYQLDLPMVANNRVFLYAYDPDGSVCSGCADDIVEMGIDNVKVTGSLQVCEASPVANPPNPVTTLEVAKTGQVDLSWSAPAVDGTHDAAAFFELWTASTPAGPFARLGTTTTTGATDSLAPATTYYSIAAVNAAGSSGNLPTP